MTEVIYMFRRRGLNDWCTCDAERYAELYLSPLFDVRMAIDVHEYQCVSAELDAMNINYQALCEVRKKLEEKVRIQKKTLSEFDDLVDVLTEGYGAASCINPLEDMKRAIEKIRGILKSKEELANDLATVVAGFVNTGPNPQIADWNTLTVEAIQVLNRKV